MRVRMERKIKSHQTQRQAVLGLLHEARMHQPDAGWMTRADLRDAIGDCEFALSVLEEVGHIKRSKYQYRITGIGVLAFEDSN